MQQMTPTDDLITYLQLQLQTGMGVFAGGVRVRTHPQNDSDHAKAASIANQWKPTQKSNPQRNFFSGCVTCDRGRPYLSMISPDLIHYFISIFLFMKVSRYCRNFDYSLNNMNCTT